ncbi:C-type lectin domain family 10 member A-like [Oryzias latipes]|uniref:C-type lectin domain family 10 member A-like n=1 Tax=Oryzias latipes TaxID=8090 RepID=UPI0005CBD75E|nr:C-type lectin domain family 10 member A-like [Oryzias latipes]
METKKLKLALSDLESKTEQLTLEKRDLQNQTEDLRMNMTKLENQTQQLTAEKMFFKNQTMEMTVNITILQNQTEDLRTNMTKLENQTQQLTAEKMLFKNQTKEMTVNMTILQNQNEQLRNNSDKLNRTQAAILKHPNLAIFCSDGVCQKCPKNWIESKESCYFFYNLDSYKAWNDSREFCQNMKSDLVVISSHEEQKFIYDTIVFYLDKWHGYWIGLQKVNNIWTWVDDSQDNLGYWNISGSPEDFAIIAKNPALTQSWVQNRNGFLNRFICEIKALIF